MAPDSDAPVHGRSKAGVAILTVGDELLSAEVEDSNFRDITSALLKEGMEVVEHRTVKDDLYAITRAVVSLAENATAIVVTGGLGPTSDDLTAQAISEATGRELVADPEVERRIREFFNRLGRPMVETNLKQAFVPAGSKVIVPSRGTAPGFILEWNGTLIAALPGVPAEMGEMLHSHVLPRFRESLKGMEFTVAKTLRIFGISESDLAELLVDAERESNAKFGYLAREGEILVKISVRAQNAEDAERALLEEEKKVRDRLGTLVYGTGETSMEEVVGKLLLKAGKTISIAESLTAGLACARMTNVPGSSEYFLGGVVTYSISSKKHVLGVSDKSLEGGAVSEQVAGQMAEKVRALFGADIGVGITGIAGPGTGGEGKPVGTVCIAIAEEEGVTSAEVRLPGDRALIRNLASMAALNMVRLRLMASVI